MLKTMTLATARPGLAPAAFRQHYESVHAPLIESLVPEIVEYRRSYVQHDQVLVLGDDGAAPSPGFDVLTETWMPDQEAVRRMMVRLAAGDGERIAADEARFLDRGSLRILPVEEYVSPLNTPGQEPDEGIPMGACKVLMLAKARSGLSRRYFVERVEAEFVPALLDRFHQGGRHLFAAHARNYLIPGKQVDLAHVEQPAAAFDCDVVFECWFRDRKDQALFLDGCRQLEGDRAFQVEQVKLIDAARILLVPVDECISRSRQGAAG